jgi:hypothetical protein
MLEFILNQLFFLGKIYIITGSLVTLSFVFINYIAQDKENEFTLALLILFEEYELNIITSRHESETSLEEIKENNVIMEKNRIIN